MGALLCLLGAACQPPLTLGAPARLWLLLPLTLAIFFLYWHSRLRRAAFARFIERGLWPKLLVRERHLARRFSAASLTAAALFLVFALARPQGEPIVLEAASRSLDLIIAIDVSDSMLAADVGGDTTSRLTRAKRKIADFLPLLAGNRVGLVAFAGDAFLQCPLTSDMHATEIFLDDIDMELIASKGTDLPRAIGQALDALTPGQGGSQAIILLTDGENNADGVDAAISRAKEAGVPIYAIGIGRTQGAPIPMRGGGFLRDRTGNMVLSRLDEKGLTQIADKTGGIYAHSQTGDIDLARIWQDGILKRQTGQNRMVKQRVHRREFYFWPTLFAAGLLALEPLVRHRSHRERNKTGFGTR